MVAQYDFQGMTRPDDLTVQKVYIHNILNVVIFVLHVYHYFQHLPFESKHIWRRQNDIAKWNYLLSRYVGLLAQLGNVLFFAVLSRRDSVPKSLCTGWLFYQYAAGRILWFLIEMTLLSRVLVIYKGHRVIRYFLVFLVGAWVVGSSIIATFSIFDANVSGVCRTHNAPINVTFLALGCLATHLIVWTLAWRKRQYKRSILTTIIRDSTRGLTYLLVVLVFIAVNNLLSNYIRPARFVTGEIYQVSFPLFIASLTWLDCYLIQHIFKEQRRQLPIVAATGSSSTLSDSFQNSGIEFTTINTTASISTTVSGVESSGTWSSRSSDGDQPPSGESLPGPCEVVVQGTRVPPAVGVTLPLQVHIPESSLSLDLPSGSRRV